MNSENHIISGDKFISQFWCPFRAITHTDGHGSRPDLRQLYVLRVWHRLLLLQHICRCRGQLLESRRKRAVLGGRNRARCGILFSLSRSPANLFPDRSRSLTLLFCLFRCFVATMAENILRDPAGQPAGQRADEELACAL